MSILLKNLVKDTTAEFVCYRDGDLWYQIVGSDGQKQIFEFPVPIADTGTGIFPSQTKAITLMRWIRKHLDKVEKGEWG